MRQIVLLTGAMLLAAFPAERAAAENGRSFSPESDLIFLHYDHAPDKDDGHSAVADRCRYVEVAIRPLDGKI